MRSGLVTPLFIALLALPSPAQERPAGPLGGELGRFLEHPRWRHAAWGALVVSLDRGDTLFSWNADRRFIPASNAKLFTTAAALRYLTPHYHFVTLLFTDGPVLSGELLGDLVLYGTGDPTFALDTAALAPFADSVVRAGIRRVRGDLVGDASFLGAELTGPGWAPDNVDRPYGAPASALSALENRIRVTLHPGPRRGAAALVELDPPFDGYTVRSTVVTGAPRSRTRIRVTRQDRTLVLTGAISATSRGWTTWLMVREPAVFAVGLLRRLLEARGVTVDGFTRSVVDDDPDRARQVLALARGETAEPPPGAIAMRRSAPLDDIVTMINHRSHNLSAELTLRTIGRVAGDAGTFANGALLVRRFLTEEVGIPRDAVRVADGSGLSVLDEATPRALVRLLAWMRAAPEGPDFVRSLPEVGTGMTRRMTNTAASGRLRAKTGTLTGVSALSGYITTEDGEQLVFALVVNRAGSVLRAREVQDSIGARLARLRRSVGTD
jgi:D-alanyl-D-alanine carboxypeptidase/D-alanyl-D-alanine-endopeptidase (penicillin-binding protein 4)